MPGFPCQKRAWLGEKQASGLTDLLTRVFSSGTKRMQEIGLQDSFFFSETLSNWEISHPYQHQLPFHYMVWKWSLTPASHPVPVAQVSTNPCPGIRKASLLTTKATRTGGPSASRKQSLSHWVPQHRGATAAAGAGRSTTGWKNSPQFRQQDFSFLEIHFIPKCLAKSGGRWA